MSPLSHLWHVALVLVAIGMGCLEIVELVESAPEAATADSYLSVDIERGEYLGSDVFNLGTLQFRFRSANPAPAAVAVVHISQHGTSVLRFPFACGIWFIRLQVAAMDAVQPTDHPVRGSGQPPASFRWRHLGVELLY